MQFDERAGTTWTQNEKTGMPQRNGMPHGLRKEVETCGLCHARRAQFSEKWISGQLLSNTHLPTPMYRNLTFADGQMRDVEELYNDLPFRQSKMFASGATAAIATIRIAPRCARREMVSAFSATHLRNMRVCHIAIMRT